MGRRRRLARTSDREIARRCGVSDQIAEWSRLMKEREERDGKGAQDAHLCKTTGRGNKGGTSAKPRRTWSRRGLRPRRLEVTSTGVLSPFSADFQKEKPCRERPRRGFADPSSADQRAGPAS